MRIVPSPESVGRALVSASFVVWLVLTGCNLGEGEASRHARGALARDGWSEVELSPVAGSPDTFDVRGMRRGQACEATVVVGGTEGRRTSAISSYCP